MAIIAKSSGDGQSFQPAPAGVHRAVCVDVIDKGVLDVTWQGKTKKQHKVDLAWQIDELRDDGKPFLVFKRYTLSLSEKATLRKDLESWRGKAFTRDDEMGFDVESVIGVNCLLNIQHNSKGDKVYANVASVMPLMRGLEPVTQNGYVRVCDRQPEQPDTQGPHTSGDTVDMAITADDIPF